MRRCPSWNHKPSSKQKKLSNGSFDKVFKPPKMSETTELQVTTTRLELMREQEYREKQYWEAVCAWLEPINEKVKEFNERYNRFYRFQADRYVTMPHNMHSIGFSKKTVKGDEVYELSVMVRGHSLDGLQYNIPVYSEWGGSDANIKLEDVQQIKIYAKDTVARLQIDLRSISANYPSRTILYYWKKFIMFEHLKEKFTGCSISLRDMNVIYIAIIEGMLYALREYTKPIYVRERKKLIEKLVHIFAITVATSKISMMKRIRQAIALFKTKRKLVPYAQLLLGELDMFNAYLTGLQQVRRRRRKREKRESVERTNEILDYIEEIKEKVGDERPWTTLTKKGKPRISPWYESDATLWKCHNCGKEFISEDEVRMHSRLHKALGEAK